MIDGGRCTPHAVVTRGYVQAGTREVGADAHHGEHRVAVIINVQSQ